MSLNVHNKISASRRDDLESICYMLMSFVKPLKWRFKERDKVKNLKKNFDALEEYGEMFDIFLSYTRKLKFTEKPNYDYLKYLLQENANILELPLKYTWDKN